MKDSAKGVILVVIIILVIIGGVAIFGSGGSDNPAPQPNGDVPEGETSYLNETPVIPVKGAMEVDTTAPDFAYYTIENSEIRLSDYIVWQITEASFVCSSSIYFVTSNFILRHRTKTLNMI